MVLGSGAAELGALLKHSPGSIVVNQDWREGLGSSIRAGVARLPPTCAGALLLLADQPAVSADDLRRLAGTWRRQPQYIAAALYSGAVGVPAIFPRSLFPELMQLRGDARARALLRAHARPGARADARVRQSTSIPPRTCSPLRRPKWTRAARRSGSSTRLPACRCRKVYRFVLAPHGARPAKSFSA